MNPIRIGRITFASALRILAVATLLVLMLLYTQFQARNLIHGPSITLNGAYEIVQQNQRLTLHGNAQNIVKLTLNGREITTNENGEFVQSVILEKGYTVLTLYAVDRFGRSTSVERAYTYVSPS